MGDTKCVLGQKKKDKYSPTVLKLKGIVTLRESVKVPAIPKVEIPQPYKVPHPQNLITRHPIYGRLDLGMKRKCEDGVDNTGDEVDNRKKKKKNKHKEDATEIVLDSKEDIENPTQKKKKKKDKVKCEEEELDIKKEEEMDDTLSHGVKKKKKKDKKIRLYNYILSPQYALFVKEENFISNFF